METKIHLYSPREEKLNMFTHFIAAVLSIAGIVAMALRVSAMAWSVALPMMIFAVSNLLVYGFSSLYHGVKDIKTKIILQKLDHSMVSMIIFGTSAPCLLYVAQGVTATVMFILVTACTVANIAFNLLSVSRYKKQSQGLYLLAIIFIAIGVSVDLKVYSLSFILLMLGGVACLGIGWIFYFKKSIEYTHVVWHIGDFLCSAMHFAALYMLLAL